MTNTSTTRHVLPCRHKGAEKRIYVVSKGDSDGKEKLDDAMRRFGEEKFDPEASPSEHFRNIADFLRANGFEEIKP